MAEKQILLVHESLAQSIMKDLISGVTLLSMVGIGVWIDSGAMQWVAGIIWLLAMVGKSTAYAKNSVFSFDDARKRLDEWEASK